ncbi:hypothetical protein GQ457_11G031770 [Hibiscus cannabinus]
MQIASLGKARRQGGSSITFVQYGFRVYGIVNKQWGGPNYAFLVSSIDTLSVVSVPNSNTGIWVSVPAREGIDTPCNAPGMVLELGYRYPYVFTRYRYQGRGIGTQAPHWDLSIGTGSRVPIPAA